MTKKNGFITAGNEGAYSVVGWIGGEAMDSILPGGIEAAKEMNKCIKLVNGPIQKVVKTQTDQAVDKVKEEHAEEEEKKKEEGKKPHEDAEVRNAF